MIPTKYYLGCIMLLLSFTIPSYGQDAQKDPIDADYEHCLAKDTSSANICDCAFVAYDRWNKEMGKELNKLQRTLKKKKDAEAIKASQQAWETYRDAEFTTYDNMFNIPGSRWCGIRQDSRIDMVRARTLQLRNYTAALKK